MGESVLRRGNILSYVRECRETFDERPLMPVDSLVLAWTIYFRVPVALDMAASPEGIALHELLRAEDFDDMFSGCFDAESSRELLFALCASPRFRDVRLADLLFTFNVERQEQFCGGTFLLPDGSAYVAFRGTDATLVGWKEDFNMAYQCPVPSQADAARYLTHAAELFAGRPLYVGGHSKGGNLAVYAASEAASEAQSRVRRVFSHDGPGFTAEFLAGEGYARVCERVEKTMPRSAIVGMCLETHEDYSIVESSSVSILQHDPFTWLVEDGNFVYAEGFSAGSRYLDRTVTAWLAGLDNEARGRFIDALYGVVASTGAKSFAQIRDNWKTALPVMAEAASELDPDTRKLILGTLASFAKAAAPSLPPLSGARAAILTSAQTQTKGTSS